MFLALMAAFAAGVNAIVLKSVALEIGEINAVFYLGLFGLIIMTPAPLLLSQRPRWIPQDSNLKQWLVLIIIGILNTVAFLAYVKNSIFC